MIKQKNIKKLDEDISEKEWEELHLPYQDNLNEYVIRYLISELVAFSISSAYYRGCLGNSDSFEQHYRSMKDIILVPADLEDVKESIEELLRIKYNLVIVNTTPLTLDKYQ